MSCKITAVSYTLPRGRLTHAELCERFGRDVMDKVASISGIYTRRTATAAECASDFAVAAAERILGDADRREIDALFFATQTPDYTLPTTACIIQQRLGLRRDIAAFDINLGCTQFVYALSTAKAYVESGLAKKVLVLCGDTPTRLINPKDKSAVALFSDAGSACIVEKNDDSAATQIADFVFGVDGRGYADLICPASAMRHPPRPEDFAETDDGSGNIRRNVDLFVNGFKIFAFAFKIVPQTVEKILQKNGMKKGDIDLFVFHQAGKKIVESAAQRLDLDSEKVWLDVRDKGNCGGSSIPIAIADAIAAGRIKTGMKVLVCAFGVGLSWGAAILDFSNGVPRTYIPEDKK